MDVPTYSPGDLVTAKGHLAYVYTHPHHYLRDPQRPIVATLHSESDWTHLKPGNFGTTALVVATCEGELVYASRLKDYTEPMSSVNYEQVASMQWLFVVFSGVVGYIPAVWTKKILNND